MSSKRGHIEVDPDYEDVSEQQSKRRKVMEEDAKAATKRKIESIIKKHFDIEIESKESELLEISEKLEFAKSIMDRLRACIVANFFGNASQQKTNSRKNLEQTPMIHPTVRKFIGKAPPGTPHTDTKAEATVISNSKQVLESEKIGNLVTQMRESVKPESSFKDIEEKEVGGSRQGRFKVKKRIIVGNVSKSIPADQRDDNDQATHKWMVYVRGSKHSPNITGFVKKVWFFLHPSYRPNDLVEVSQPPFHLTRRGWGEFPVRVQIHFKDSRNKRVDIIHNLKLDRTYTGLQTLGAETVVDIEIERDMADVKLEKKHRGDSDSRNKDRSTRLSHNTDIKQEPPESGYNSQENTQIHCQTFPMLQDIKLEPVDHDYGRSTCVNMVSNGVTIADPINASRSVKKELESQAGSGQNCANSPGHGQNLLTCIQTIGSPSVITTQAMPLLTSISHSHNHLALNSTSPSKQQILSKNGNFVLTSPPGNIVFRAVGPAVTGANHSANSTVNLKLVDTGAVKTGTGSPATVSFTLTQPGGQTVLPGNKSLNASQTRIPVNQSGNSGLIFLKCTDNQGKTFLIPQQINNTLTSPTKGVNSIGGVKAGASNTRPVLLTGGLPVSNVGNLGVTGNMGTVQGKQIFQTLVRSPNMMSSTARPQKTPVQNGPVFFIKPDHINRTPLTVKTSNISSNTTTPIKVNSNLQIVRNCSQKQNSDILCVKPVNSPLTSPDNQSVNKGQLKVTPQGLIHVQGQTISPAVGLSTEKNLQGSIRPKQPIVLIPSNGKVTLLPNKGKSLLNSVTNIPSTPTSGNNIILFNQSVSPIGNNNVACVVPSTTASQKQSVSMINKSDMFVLQTKPSKCSVSTPNHLVIIPVSSEQNSSIVTTTSLNTLTSVTMTTASNRSGTSPSHVSNSMDTKTNDKTMFIVVQNDKNTVGGVTNSLIDSSKLTSKSAASLLSPSVTSLNSNTSSKSSSASHHLTQVTVSSSDAKPKQILLVNQEDSVDGLTTEKPMEDRKCIMDPKKKKQKVVPVREFIQPLCMKDYPDLLSLLRATVCRHPLVSECTGRSLHPYCARTNEDWLTWNVGKRRAAEWQRASCVRKYILQALGGSTVYKGESLWTTKQILVWCRLHAYSPHYLERPLHPTGIDLQAETSIISDKHRKKFSSLTSVTQIHEDLLNTEHLTETSDVCDEDIDILSDAPVQTKVKVEDQSSEVTTVDDPEYLPLTDGAMYVEEMAQQIGVRLQQTEVEPGYMGTLAHGMLYKSMENFMSDILRETFALQVNMGRYPDTLAVGDVYRALNNLSKTDFLTNKYLGVEDNIGINTFPT